MNRGEGADKSVLLVSDYIMREPYFDHLRVIKTRRPPTKPAIFTLLLYINTTAATA